MSIKVSIIEDDEWIRENLASQIRQTHGFSCAGCYRNGEEALTNITKAIPDVVLMDINLPRMSGIECVRKLKTMMPSTHVLMLTVYEDSDKIFDSLLAGASGYLLKRTPQAEILEAIRDVSNGNSPMTGHIARKVVQYFNQRGHAQLGHGFTLRQLLPFLPHHSPWIGPAAGQPWKHDRHPDPKELR